MSAADTTYRVEIYKDAALIYVTRRAGICGPANVTPRPATLAEVDAWLTTVEFNRTGEWELSEGYDGLRLAADVERVERPPVTITVAEWVAPGADSDHHPGRRRRAVTPMADAPTAARDRVVAAALANGWTLRGGDESAPRLSYWRGMQNVDVEFDPAGRVQFATGARRGIAPARRLAVALALLGGPRPFNG